MYVCYPVNIDKGLENKVDLASWALAGLLNGLLIGGVAVQYPFGTVIVIVYIIVYGIGVVGLSMREEIGNCILMGTRWYTTTSYSTMHTFIPVCLSTQERREAC